MQIGSILYISAICGEKNVANLARKLMMLNAVMLKSIGNTLVVF